MPPTSEDELRRQNRERQRRYREAAATRGSAGERRLNTWLAAPAFEALQRLSQHFGLPQKALIERLILAADAALTAERETLGTTP